MDFNRNLKPNLKADDQPEIEVDRKEYNPYEMHPAFVAFMDESYRYDWKKDPEKKLKQLEGAFLGGMIHNMTSLSAVSMKYSEAEAEQIMEDESKSMVIRFQIIAMFFRDNEDLLKE